MNRTILFVGLGGLLGGIARFITASYVNKLISSAFPYGTLVVNLSGCFIIGIIYGLSERFHWLTPEWRFFLATGFCGGYTTFSAFAYENVKLLETTNYLTFASYSIISFALCLLATFIGLTFTKI
ncbi:MAG TPA: fluoride efflux transporter CrcB [Chryseolinea sp.]|nr:fluoride efflux transporter CrcB [Chryseolinea sp.]